MTTLPKAVIEDLLPLYAAGEASAETVALVEQELVRYPELREQAEAMRQVPLAVSGVPDGELRAVGVTTDLLSRRTWSLAVAIFTFALPWSIAVQHGKVTFQMARDQPAVAAVSLAVAYCAWLVYFDARRRLHATGLQRSRKPWQRFLWLMLGTAIGFEVVLLLGGAWWHAVFPLLSAGLFFWQSRLE